MKLALFELRRFRRALLSRVALVVLTLIPLLYGALYLWAFWDPYGGLKHIPVAIVVEDRPARVADGSTVDAGRQLADTLVDRQVFGWHRTTEAQAEQGLADGTYHLMLRIPADFSSSLASPLDSSRAPRRGQLVVVSDDATNYLSGLLARSAFTEIRASAASGAARGYFDRMLIGFSDLKAETARAAAGAGQLADGTRQAAGGAGDAARGADAAANGAGALAGGLGTATTGAGQLADGLAALDAGSAQLADGTAQAAAGGRLLAGRVDAAADRIGPVLRDNAVAIQRAATALADGADLIAANLTELPRLADQAVVGSTAVRDRLRTISDSLFFDLITLSISPFGATKNWPAGGCHQPPGRLHPRAAYRRSLKTRCRNTLCFVERTWDALP